MQHGRKGKKKPHEFVPYGQRRPEEYQAAQCCRQDQWQKDESETAGKQTAGEQAAGEKATVKAQKKEKSGD